MDLSQFTSLEAFEWRGVQRNSHLLGLRNCLQACAQTLKSLYLDFLTEGGFNSEGDLCRVSYDDLLSTQILGIVNNDRGQLLFPTLESLSFRFGQLGNDLRYFVPAFPWEQLHTLKVNECEEGTELMEAVSDAGRTFERLRHFEFMGYDLVASHWLPQFLDACPILENLCVSYHDGNSDDLLPWPANFPIKRLVHHDQLKGKLELKRSKLLRVLQQTRLEFLGLRFHITPLLALLQSLPLSSRPPLKLLHIRTEYSDHGYGRSSDIQSEVARDAAALAEWAFSVDGFSQLEMIIWGDTAYNFRAKYNKYFVRAHDGPSHGFREIEDVEEVRRFSVVSEFKEMLEACPVMPLVEAHW